MSLETELKQLGITALDWKQANKAAKRSICHELLQLNPAKYNETIRQQRQDLITEYFETCEVSTAKADYLKSVYKFKKEPTRQLQIWHVGTWQKIDEDKIHLIWEALKWKFPNNSKADTETILKSII